MTNELPPKPEGYALQVHNPVEVIRVDNEGKVLLLVNNELVDTGVVVDRAKLTPDVNGMIFVMRALAERCIEYRQFSLTATKH